MFKKDQYLRDCCCTQECCYESMKIASNEVVSVDEALQRPADDVEGRNHLYNLGYHKLGKPRIEKDCEEHDAMEIHGNFWQYRRDKLRNTCEARRKESRQSWSAIRPMLMLLDLRISYR